MTFSPKNIPISITGSQAPVLHSEVPQGLSDYANPTITDPKIAAKFLFENKVRLRFCANFATQCKKKYTLFWAVAG